MDHEIDQSTEPRRKRRLPLANTSPRTRSVLLATGVLVVGIAPFGIAATGDSLREGRRNGTTAVETEIAHRVGIHSRGWVLPLLSVAGNAVVFVES